MYSAFINAEITNYYRTQMNVQDERLIVRIINLTRSQHIYSKCLCQLLVQVPIPEGHMCGFGKLKPPLLNIVCRNLPPSQTDNKHRLLMF